MTAITPGTNGIPATFGIPEAVLRSLFPPHPAGTLRSPTLAG